MLAFLRRGLHDISVSRSVRRARGWGIPVPDDPDQVVYVWFDALDQLHQRAALRRRRQPRATSGGGPASDRRVHVIGKGILRFHAVYWPAFLLSAGVRAPDRGPRAPVPDGERRQAVQVGRRDRRPGRLVDRASAPIALRWWLRRDPSPTPTPTSPSSGSSSRADDDLANGIGNAVNRIVTLIHRHRDGVRPTPDAEPLPETIDLPRHRGRRCSATSIAAAPRRAVVDAIDALTATSTRRRRGSWPSIRHGRPSSTPCSIATTAAPR